jgi:hypothetical protein
MKNVFARVGLLVALMCAPVLTACSALPPVSAVSTQNTVIDERVLWGAEALYNVPAQAYKTADQNGTLPDSVRVVVRPLLIKAFDAIKAAYSAKAIGDATSFYAQIEAAKRFTAEAKAIIAPGT